MPTRAIWPLLVLQLSGCCWFSDDCEPDPVPIPSVPTVAREVSLGIVPVQQATPVWCWVASGEMVFRHYGIPNVNPGGHYQCGIVGILYPICNFNCLNCNVTASSIWVVNDMIYRYPQEVRAHSVPSSPLLAAPTVASQALTLAATTTQLNARRPIVAGVSPSGFRFPWQESEHAVVIVGYQEMSDGSVRVLVNDPWPYGQFQSPNPYLQAGGVAVRAGQYAVDYSRFVQQLLWRETIFNIREAGAVAFSTSSLEELLAQANESAPIAAAP
jgi:hypothetical protein